jgi:hypothetical protein
MIDMKMMIPTTTQNVVNIKRDDKKSDSKELSKQGTMTISSHQTMIDARILFQK